jgi:hypothetical protein
MNTAWNHLPNKIHIDQVLVDLKNHSNLFVSAWQHARGQPREQAYKQAYKQAHVQARDRAYHQAWDHAWYKLRHNACYVVQTALLSLIAYDDASKYLIMPVDQAIVYGELISDRQYILLKSYLQVKHEAALLATT